MNAPSFVRRLPAAGAALAVVAATGCATVSPDELETRLSTLREDVSEEIAQGDREVRNEMGDRIGDVETRLTAMERDLATLEEEFDVTVERLETALRFNVPVHFAFDDDAVRAQDRRLLDRFGNVVRSYYPDALITVEGFTDPAGSAEYNRRLGQRRADGVKSYLVESVGLFGDRIRTVSYGESTERQVVQGAQGPGESGLPNRRVVLVIDHGGEPPTVRPTVTATDADAATPSGG